MVALWHKDSFSFVCWGFEIVSKIYIVSQMRWREFGLFSTNHSLTRWFHWTLLKGIKKKLGLFIWNPAVAKSLFSLSSGSHLESSIRVRYKPDFDITTTIDKYATNTYDEETSSLSYTYIFSGFAYCSSVMFVLFAVQKKSMFDTKSLFSLSPVQSFSP